MKTPSSTPTKILALVPSGVLLAALGCGSGPVEVQTVSEYNHGKVMSGIRVQVNDAAWAETDAEGRAVFEGVNSPYTMRVLQVIEFERPGNGLYPEDATVRLVDAWQLVDRTDDSVVLTVDEGPSLGDPERCEVSGTIEGAEEVPPVISDGVTSGLGDLGSEVTDAAFSLSLPQMKVDTLPLRALTVLRGADPYGFPTGYGPAGKLDAQIPGGTCGQMNGLRLALEPIDSAQTVVSYRVPDAFSSNVIRTYAGVGFADVPEAGIYLGGTEASDRSGTVEVPLPNFGAPYVGVTAIGDDERVIEEGTNPTKYWERFTALGGVSRAHRTVEPGASGLSLELPTPTRLLAPDDGATLTADTVFRWEAAGDDVMYELHLACRPRSPTGNLNLRTLQTRSTEAVLPDVVFEEAVRPGMRCIWTVRVVQDTDTGYRAASAAERVLLID